MEQETILVTGAAGFVGSHLVDNLLALGKTVIGLDNFDDYYDPTWKESNIAKAKMDNSFHMIHGDIRNKVILSDIFKKWTVQKVVHLAAKVGVRNSLTNPESYVDVNVTGTANLLESAKSNNISRFVLASSSSVYGNQLKMPLKEDAETDRPSSPYAATKKAAEVLAYSYNSLYNLPITCLRFFTVYGPRGRPDMATFKFMDNIYREQAIPRFGDGSSSRDYTYVTDIVQGVLGAIDADLEYEIINLGNSDPIKLNDFIHAIEETVGKDAIIDDQENQLGDVKMTYADISKARRFLGYSPKVTLQIGLEKTFDWYKIQFA